MLTWPRGNQRQQNIAHLLGVKQSIIERLNDSVNLEIIPAYSAIGQGTKFTDEREERSPIFLQEGNVPLMLSTPLNI